MATTARFTKRVIERGNVTIPSDVRDALGIDEGDFVEFEIVGIVKKADGTTPGPVPPRAPDPPPSESPNPQGHAL